MSVISSDILAGASGQAGGAPAGYEIERSLRFNSADSAYLSRTPASAGNRRTFTWSGWVKRSGLGAQSDFFSAGNSSDYLRVGGFNSSDKLELRSDSAVVHVVTDQVFRDVSAWYHIVIAVDTTQSTSSNRVKFYVNGSQITDFSTSSYPSQNRQEAVNDTGEHRVGAFVNKTNATVYYPFNGYLADVHFLDGQTPSTAIDTDGSVTGIVGAEYLTDFGEFDDNGVWQPIEFTPPATPNDGTTWSSGCSGDVVGPTLAFDGRIDSASNSYTTGGPDWAWTNPVTDSITVNTSLRVFAGTGNTSNTAYVNGTQIGGSGVISTTTQWNDLTSLLTLPINFNSLTLVAGTSGFNVRAIEVDGVTLIDGDTSNIGVNGFHLDFSDNSTAAALGTDAAGSNDWTVNNIVGTATQWSSYGDGNSYWAATVFDSTTTETTFPGGTTMTWDANAHPTGITWSTSLKIRYLKNSNGGPFVFNGTTLTLGNTGALTWTTVDISSQVTSPLRTISLSRPAESSSESGLVAIYVDDVLVTDSSASEIDSLLDSPQNGTQTDTGAGGEVSGNYATLNPLRNGGLTLSNGNLQANRATTSWQSTFGTIGITSGKYFWEAQIVTSASINYIDLGIANATVSPSGTYRSTSGYSYNGNDELYANGSYVSTYGGTYTAGDIIGVAFDADAGTLVYYKNGTSLGTAFSSIPSGTWFPAVALYGTREVAFNFGQRAFAYSAPSGYKALCTTNLPDPTIADGSDYMDVALYTGTGNPLTVSGLSFSPDFVWLKNRGNAASHRLTDIVRGATKSLFSDSTTDELTETGSLTAFTSDGFTLGTGGGVNNPGTAAVAWTWDAGTSNTTYTAGVTPGAGSISSVVRANPSAGFSVVSYTGVNNAIPHTIGHGLGATPQLVIIKNRTDAENWAVYHASLGNTKYLQLNTINAAATSSAYWNNTDPTSTVITLNNSADVQRINRNYIAYCFAPVEGYSAFGSYTGNGSATDGPFVFTNFRPRWILVRSTSANRGWVIWDTSRDPHNVADANLFPNNSSAESSSSDHNIDILSNGFKLRTTSVNRNGSGETYIYAAFAENPFKTARAR